jgi:hypothetical protein
MQPSPSGDLMRIVHGGDGEMTQVLCGFHVAIGPR